MLHHATFTLDGYTVQWFKKQADGTLLCVEDNQTLIVADALENNLFNSKDALKWKCDFDVTKSTDMSGRFLDLVKEIKKELMGVEGVKGVFDIILHNYGPDVMIGSLHISVPDSMSAHEIHILTRKISTMIFDRHGIILTVGIYATATQDSTRAELQSKVIQTLAAHKEIVQVHGFLYSENDRLLSVDVVPDISSHDDAALREKLTEEIQKLCPDLQVVIVIDHNYSE